VVKNKLKKFAENLTFPNLFQPTVEEVREGFMLKGKWNRNFFNNDHPIVLELGCGKGEYTVALAKKYPEKNFIGIDIKGARLWRGAKTSQLDNLSNVAFIKSYIGFIEDLFAANEVCEIWITFPDPQPRMKQVKKRLTSPRFLNHYRNIMQSGGIIHLKTDNIELFDFTLREIERNNYELLYFTKDLYGTDSDGEVAETQTFYEQMFLKKGMKINYLKFRLGKGKASDELLVASD
jgi:tRNA (guanine-N7-)-methyltransferase